LIRFLHGLGLKLQRTDPVILPVSRIRSEILGAAEGAWRAGGSNSLLGQIFHQSFCDLFTATHDARWQRFLTPELLEDPSQLARHVYRELAGPRIARQQAALQEFSQELLNFWDAIQRMCTWFCNLLRSALDQKLIRYDELTGYWINVDMLVRPEQELYWEIRDPEWTAPVRIEGRADAVFRKPGTNSWCVVEYKIGGVAPEADLAQVCLYHGMLSAANDGEGEVAMLYFHPELKEQLFDGPALEPALALLKPVIGRLAGVLGGTLTATQIRRITTPPKYIEPEPMDVMGSKVLEVCREFGANAHLAGEPIIGPTFCRYAIEPARGVPAKKFQGLALDLQVRLGLDAPPLISVQGGQLVIDLQRPDRQVVGFSQVRDQLSSAELSSRVPVGVDLNGVLRFIDLANPLHAHVLVAGTSGSGKTEWLRTAIAGMIVANTPASLRFVLIDPKRVAFGDMRDSPFLYVPDALVYPDGLVSVIDIFDALIEEMEARYRAHQRAFVDDLRQYIDKTGDRRPRIVCVCDEYADLIATDRRMRREVESRIARLGAKARAAGIHLIVATQRPSRDIVSGTLQANMTCRVAMKMQSPIESRLLLGQSGAEHLLGNGDLLFQDIQDPIRLQSPLLSEADRKSIFSGVAQTV
jgi:S-DNA-T family DNA segregation ATPase FtsK/SpoIIIE